MLTRLVTFIVALALGGCATCERHPVACTAASAILVGSVAATIAANSHHGAEPAHLRSCGFDCHIN